MINSIFGGWSTQLVLQALGEQKVSEEELAQIQVLLNNLKKQWYVSVEHFSFSPGFRLGDIEQYLANGFTVVQFSFGPSFF